MFQKQIIQFEDHFNDIVSLILYVGCTVLTLNYFTVYKGKALKMDNPAVVRFLVIHCVASTNTLLLVMRYSQRKILTPTFHFNILQRFVKIFDKESKNMMKSLKKDLRKNDKIIAERKLYHEQTNGQYLKSFDNGHDITASSLCFILTLLAEHKDIYHLVRNEVDIAMQENEDKLIVKFLNQLLYLEKCIKEALRLQNIVPLISRICGEDVKLRTIIFNMIAADTIVIIDINGIHKDPNFWPNPEVFDPRFLPERIINDMLYCKYVILKMMIASLIHHFYLEPIDYIENVRLQIDIILRPHPLCVRFVPVLQN
ncbi:Cytochrome P450 4C1 [Atta colombica]|uniref:Cytochrome P450 4C1 n=1 Tax=Atta colombica TaxID=520822 RepID=A0A195BGW4_9HYME|nr:Cytochrome P450 4C1 [Atta colombica]